MKKEKLIPKRRFKEFANSEAWEQHKLGDLGSVAMNKRIFKHQTSEAGDVPFYKIGTFGGKPNAYIPRELFEEYKAKYPYPEIGDILISASGSIGRTVEYTGKDEYFQDSNIVWLKHDGRLDNSFLKQFYLVVNWEGLEGSTIKRLYNKNILETEILAPSLVEQAKIGTFFHRLDNLITLHQRKLKKLKETKSAYLSEMFPEEGEKYPKRRFAGFTDPWEQSKLKELCSIITKQTGFDYSATIKPSLIIEKDANAYPFIQNKDFNGLKINLKTDFYIPKKVAENFPKILLDKPSVLISISGKIGNVGLYNLRNKAFIGGAVGICKLLDEKEGLMIVYYLLSEAGQKYFQSLIKASSHSNITVEDIRNIEIKMPRDRNESEKIGTFFNQLEELITLHKRKLEKLENLKKAYLNEMLV